MSTVRLSFLSALLFFTLSVHTASAQKEFILNGVVINNDSKLRLALAEITNKRNNYGVGSNDMGLFQIRAVVGDTLLITKRGFNDKEIVINSTKDVVIYLNRGVTLNEVVINGNSKKQELDAIKRDFEAKGSFYGGKPPLSLLLPFGGSPLTFLYELFGRTPRNARRFGRYYTAELQQTKVDQYFNRSLINQHTGLTGKELDNFMINYRPDYEKVKNWNVYDGTKYIKDSFKKYSDTVKR
jgi:hypothetical protein